jgi:hypothetical protein
LVGKNEYYKKDADEASFELYKKETLSNFGRVFGAFFMLFHLQE